MQNRRYVDNSIMVLSLVPQALKYRSSKTAYSLAAFYDPLEGSGNQTRTEYDEMREGYDKLMVTMYQNIHIDLITGPGSPGEQRTLSRTRVTLLLWNAKVDKIDLFEYHRYYAYRR